MPTGVIVTFIIGLLCIIFTLVYQKNINLRVAIGVIGVIFLFYSGFSFGNIQPIAHLETFDSGNRLEIPETINKVEVLSPVEGDEVKCRILTSGVYPDGHDKDIWVLLRPSDKKYYPQSDYTNTSFKLNGEWQVVTRFGGDEGEQFVLFVFEADPQASAFFSKTIENWKASEAYIGLMESELPAGIKEIDRLNVILKGDCRGVF
jgi:hypothetical protein